ncbi:secondary thiamine-phosphate synthase enzyme YjbQ [Myxococcota bacterium]|nr:secondary thiamine-phosphate synthase enzyme YjbQ [Myxococcota bacterium]
MSTFTKQLTIETRGRSINDITREVAAAVQASGMREGLANVFIRHTSASLIIGENADPDVLRDLERFMGDLVPDGDRRYVHTAEGPDDMPSHVRAVLTATSISVPIVDGRLALGTWQAIYLWEHRTRPYARSVLVTIVG